MRCSLENSVARTLSAGHVSLESRTGADEALGNVKVCGVHLEIVVCICDCTLEELYERCSENGITLIFSHVNEQPMKVMKKAGFVKKVGEENFVKNIHEALKKSRQRQ